MCLVCQHPISFNKATEKGTWAITYPTNTVPVTVVVMYTTFVSVMTDAVPRVIVTVAPGLLLLQAVKGGGVLCDILSALGSVSSADTLGKAD